MTAPKTYSEHKLSAEDRLIIALDVESADAARDVVKELDGLGATFKIGLQLFTAGGPALVDELVSRGVRVFLDLKFHDIPNTVAKAGIEAAKLGVWMFNIHAAGGSEMMKRTVGETAAFCEASNRPRPLIIGVTVLTSSASETLRETSVEKNVKDQVSVLSRLVSQAGLDGVVASAEEIGIIRAAVPVPGFRIVTPGIRPENGTNDDQKRVMTPGAAILAGADHLVIGRPILHATDRRATAEKLLNEIREAC